VKAPPFGPRPAKAAVPSRRSRPRTRSNASAT